MKKLYNDPLLNKSYISSRKKYLEKIDLNYLDFTYEIGITDQIDKQKKDYEKTKRKGFDKLKESIIKKGFPGERLLGIPDSLIFKELKSDKKDLYDRLKRHGSTLSYFTLDAHILSQRMAILILVHNFCSYKDLQDLWMKEIKKGNIHPRDVALIYDNSYRGSCTDKIKGFYKLNIFVNYERYSFKDNLINDMRKKMYITSLELDAVKADYQTEHGFKLFWGFWKCR